jgi:pyruvate dehydrogenase E1 component beta subunit
MAERTLTYLKALTEAQREEMRRDERVFLIGNDVRSGLFGTTKGFVEEFGEERVRDTPLAELGFVGTSVGAAMTGMRPIVDFTIASFVYVAMDQMISQAAKSRYMFGGQVSVPIVFRAALFYGGANAAQHSDRPYPIFMSVPGIKVIVPATPYDAKGMLKAAIRDDDPVFCFEDSTVWFSKGDVPEEDYIVPIGKAAIKREGPDATVITVAGSLIPALAAAERLASEDGISVTVVDVRTLVPLDWETVLGAAAATGRVVVVDPAHRTCSAASEISATITEEIFDSLKAPVIRVTTPDTHIPFSQPLEKTIYPNADRIVAAVQLVCRERTGVKR